MICQNSFRRNCKVKPLMALGLRYCYHFEEDLRSFHHCLCHCQIYQLSIHYSPEVPQTDHGSAQQHNLWRKIGRWHTVLPDPLSWLWEHQRGWSWFFWSAASHAWIYCARSQTFIICEPCRYTGHDARINMAHPLPFTCCPHSARIIIRTKSSASQIICRFYYWQTMSRYEISCRFPHSPFRAWCSLFEVDEDDIEEEYMLITLIHDEQWCWGSPYTMEEIHQSFTFVCMFILGQTPPVELGSWLWHGSCCHVGQWFLCALSALMAGSAEHW